MFHLFLFEKPEIRMRYFCWLIALCPQLADCPNARGQAVQSKDAQPRALEPGETESELEGHLLEELPPETILADLEQFRALLKTEWLAGALSEADFDAAIDDLAKHAANGMTRSELLVELQKILSLGIDGHAVMTRWVGVLGSFQKDQGFPDFVIDICGDDYIAYRLEHLPEGSVNPRYRYRFKLLREGFPYLSAIDGVPIEEWVETISAFVPKGPELSVRWRCIQRMHYLPFWRDQMGLPQSKSIAVQLTSQDKSKRIELKGPVGTHALHHYHIPRPDWKIVDDKFGYLWIRNPASGGVEVVLDAMPRFRDTKGLIVDLRGNTGGAGIETLQLMAAFLLPPDEPRRVVASGVQWAPWREKQTDGCFTSDDSRLSKAGRKIVAAHQAGFKPHWNPPSHRAVEWRYMLLARPGAEPGIFPFNHPKFPTEQVYHYASPVVVLMDHRNFSAGELFVAGIRRLDHVTLVGSPTTAAGGTSPELFTLEKGGLELMLGVGPSFAQVSGDFIDGKGVQPDIIVPADVDYYLGRRDQTLETAIQVLKEKLATNE